MLTHPSCAKKSTEQSMSQMTSPSTSSSQSSLPITTMPELMEESIQFMPSIVTIASTSGLHAMPKFSPYCASKHAVLGLIKTAAKEFAHKIRINSICPGTIYTPMYERFLTSYPEWQKNTNASYPIQRIGTPEEIARMAVFMCGLECGFMVGEQVVIDGGGSL